MDPNTVLPIETSADFTLLPWGSLRIHRASRDHVGTYTCSHTHSAVSVSSKLIVLGKPVLCLSVENSVLGERLVLVERSVLGERLVLGERSVLGECGVG